MRVGILFVICISFAIAGCRPKNTVLHRERAADHDKECADSVVSKAYFYPAKNRNDYGPDDPRKDGCMLLVPDHLFCCP